MVLRCITAGAAALTEVGSDPQGSVPLTVAAQAIVKGV